MPENSLNQNNGTDSQNQNQPSSLNKNQKIAAGVLAVFALLVIGLWAAQFKKSISQPFAYTPNNGNIQGQAISGEDGEDSDTALRAKDTDKDGLNDYDELNIYNTSPYLEDSDSDGFSDKQEIDSENDPNCPVGRDCFSSGLVNEKAGQEKEDQQQSSLNTLLDQFGQGQPAGSAGGTTPSEEELKALVGSQMDAATLRLLLIGPMT